MAMTLEQKYEWTLKRLLLYRHLINLIGAHLILADPNSKILDDHTFEPETVDTIKKYANLGIDKLNLMHGKPVDIGRGEGHVQR